MSFLGEEDGVCPPAPDAARRHRSGALTAARQSSARGRNALSYAAQSYINALEFASILNPCSAAAKALSLYNLTVNGGALFDNGFTLKGALLTLYDLGAVFGACFAGDMLLLCEGGKKRADAIREGDQLWSRNERDPDGPLMLKRVLHVFERTAKIWELRLPGQVLRTTLEHPFWVENRQAWLPVGEMQAGGVVRTDAGELLPVEEIEDTGKWERVYNWEVEDYHTYFVSATDEGASIWEHNAECYHYTDEQGIKGMNSSRKIRVSLSRYTRHGVDKPAIFLTPDPPAKVIDRGVSAYGLTRDKVKYVIQLDIPDNLIKKIRGGRGEYIWYVLSDIQLPSSGSIGALSGL